MEKNSRPTSRSARVSFFCLLMAISCKPLFAQTELGMINPGIQEDDRFGWSMALSFDGNWIVIGAPGSGIGSRHDIGRFDVYEFDSIEWNKRGNSIEGLSSPEQFGFFVDISKNGKIVAIGSPQAWGGNKDSGIVRVYEYVDSLWTQIGNDIDGESLSDASGLSLSLSLDGRRVAIGSPFNSDAGEHAGHIRAFEFDGQSWIQLGSSMKGDSAGVNLGYGVSLSGDGQTIVSQNKLFQYRGQEWEPSSPELPGGMAKIALDGSRVAVTEVTGDSTLGWLGVLRVFDKVNDSWSQVGQDLVGQRVSMRWRTYIDFDLSYFGDRILVRRVDENPELYEYNGHFWRKSESEIPEIPSGERFRQSSLSGNGSRIAISSNLEAGWGRVRLYEDFLAVSNNMEVPESVYGLIVYPNPSNSSRLITFEHKLGLGEIEFIDMTGRVVYQLPFSRNRKARVDLSRLPKGVYFARSRIEDNAVMTPLILQ